MVHGHPVEVLQHGLLASLLERLEQIDLLNCGLLGSELLQESGPEVLPGLEVLGHANPREGRGLRHQLHARILDPIILLIACGLESRLDEEDPIVCLEDLARLLSVSADVLRAGLEA